MASKLIEEQSITVTAQEAESILELWAKRQSENEALRARVTVSDLAEAMAIPPTEVVNMLLEVRGTPLPATPPIQPQEQTRRNRNRVLIGVAGVVWVALLVFAIGFAYSYGQVVGRHGASEAPSAEYVGTGATAPAASGPVEKFGATTATPTSN